LENVLISIRDVDILKEKCCGVKVNVNFALKQAMKVQMGSSSTLSLTSELVGGVWLTPCPGRFTLGKETLYPL
jgi:hypothetical protein